MSQFIFKHTTSFNLESGITLPELTIAYHTFGNLNADKSNIIWVCHALTANSNVFDWWQGLFGENDFYNPKEYFIVCANNLGSCYGTTGPLSINPETNEPWFSYFPKITVKDVAASFELLKEHLQITKIHTLIGGSQGGQIAMEWALLNKSLVNNLILIATNAQHSPWGIAFNESQRLAIKADRTYYSNTADAAQKGLAAARSIALLSYRSYDTYHKKQYDENYAKTDNYASASYQKYQGEKLVKRFNSYSYVRLLDAMDSHNVARNRAETIEQALNLIVANTLIIGVKSDILFPLTEQQFLANNINKASFTAIDSIYGHDGFLIETEQLTKAISTYYTSQTSNKTEVV